VNKTAESLAALEAVHFAKEVGFLDAIFEGDATHVITEINSNPPYLSPYFGEYSCCAAKFTYM
jgi:hypothetical protein